MAQKTDLVTCIMNPVRRRILRACWVPKTTVALRRILNLSGPGTSQHLGILLKAGLVTKTEPWDGDQRLRYYQTVPEVLTEALQEFSLEVGVRTMRVHT